MGASKPARLRQIDSTGCARCLPKNTILSKVSEGVELKLQQMALNLCLHTAQEKTQK